MTPVLQLKNIRKSCGGVTAIEGFSLDLHLPGTDHLGRDMLSRVIFGARVSMTTGIRIVVVSLLVDLPVGLPVRAS